MVRRINMLILSAVLTVIIFIITTAVQRIFVHYEPTVRVVSAVKDIQENKILDTYMFKTIEVPLSMVVNLKVVKKPEDVQDHYSMEPIHKGEILLDQAIASKGEVKIIPVEPGKEKVSVKLKAPENAISYQVKTGDIVRLYFTGRYEDLKNLAQAKEFYMSAEKGLGGEDFCTVKLLENAVVLGVFDNSGIALGDYARKEKVDTVVFSTTHEEALAINNCKGQGSFDITGLPYLEGGKQ